MSEKVNVVAREQAAAFARLRRKIESIDLSSDVRVMSTGVIAFDYIMGGGLPEGRLTEIYGDFSSGKSVFVYQAIAQTQRAGGVAMLHDSEGALNEPWAEMLGIDLDRLFYYEPMPIESVFQQMEDGIEAVRSDSYFRDKPFLIAWDSVAATQAEEESRQPYGHPEVALRARVISAGLRRLTRLIRDSRAIAVFVNQLRDRPMVLFGETEETTGGRAIKFHASLRLKMRKKGGKAGKIVEGDRVVGMRGDLECTKSKVCVPFRYADFELYYDRGILRDSGLLALAVREGKVQHEPKSTWYSIGEKKFRASEFNEELWREALARTETEDRQSESRAECEAGDG